MRLIDADELLSDKHTHTLPKGFGIVSGRVIVFADDVERMPTIEAQEVKHGKWIETMLDKYKKVECKCSVCGWIGVDNYDSYVDIGTFDYCPNCGARMDGDER